MSLWRIISGILVSFGALFFCTTFLIPDEGSCPAIIVGQSSSLCEHYYPGTTIYVPTIWRILTVLSVLAFGAGTTLFLISTHYGRRSSGMSSKLVGTILVTITTSIALGGLVVPIMLGSIFFSTSAFLYGLAVGLVLSTGLYLLPHQNVSDRGASL